jgi:hypothetical protein
MMSVRSRSVDGPLAPDGNLRWTDGFRSAGTSGIASPLPLTSFTGRGRASSLTDASV